ncbi:MAG: class II aldolase/adducin family protein [Betaproteobacteria bacterium]|nr:class II aldolase/adducin family protein [Betaproteobacteria bacterium]
MTRLPPQDTFAAAPHPEWDEQAAAACPDELSLRALTSRWIGGDPTLALYGGGNTSVKAPWTAAEASASTALFVKGSGADLAAVTPGDFTPVALDRALALLDAHDLDNDALMRALGPLKLDPASPRPSIETLMHACLPHRYVEHTHADAVLAVINTEGGEASAARVFGSCAPLVPFRHSGFDLAMACADVYRREATDASIGLLLAFHGVVAFGDSARQSYEHLYELVRRAERHLQENGAWDLPRAVSPVRSWETALRLARLRAGLSVASGFPMVLTVDDSPEAVAFCRRSDATVLARIGPPTPQHAVFTKRFPALRDGCRRLCRGVPPLRGGTWRRVPGRPHPGSRSPRSAGSVRGDDRRERRCDARAHDRQRLPARHRDRFPGGCAGPIRVAAGRCHSRRRGALRRLRPRAVAPPCG